jgi:hypothetical protein
MDQTAARITYTYVNRHATEGRAELRRLCDPA